MICIIEACVLRINKILFHSKAINWKSLSWKPVENDFST